MKKYILPPPPTMYFIKQKIYLQYGGLVTIKLFSLFYVVLRF